MSCCLSPYIQNPPPPPKKDNLLEAKSSLLILPEELSNENLSFTAILLLLLLLSLSLSLSLLSLLLLLLRVEWTMGVILVILIMLKEDYHIINKLIIQIFSNYGLNFYTFLLSKKHLFYGLFFVLRMYFFFYRKRDKKCFFAAFKLGFHPPSSADFHRFEPLLFFACWLIEYSNLI